MAITAPSTDCTCGEIHDEPISDQEVINGLDELWAAGEINTWSSLYELHIVGDWSATHVTPELRNKWIDSLRFDTCLYGDRHRKADCTTDCGDDI